MGSIPPLTTNPPERRRGLIAREWAKEKARAMRAAMGLPDDPRLDPRR